jgi:hypothetical protein
MFRGTLRALTEPTTSRPTSLSGICIEHSDLDLMALDHTRQVQPGPAQQHDEKSVATSKGVAVLYCLMIAHVETLQQSHVATPHDHYRKTFASVFFPFSPDEQRIKAWFAKTTASTKSVQV